MGLSADPTDWALAAAALTLWLGFTLWRLWPRRSAVGDVLIGYASQSGIALALAEERAKALRAAGLAPVLLAMNALRAGDLARASRAIFILATTGEGDAPANAAAFARRMAEPAPALPNLSYALLALGDSAYPRFCAFGRAVDGWLQGAGAQPLAPLTEADRADPARIAAFDAVLGAAFGATGPEPDTSNWILTNRTQLNAPVSETPLWRVVLEPAGAMPDWQAGDIAGVQIPAEGGPALRSYSVASVPGDGRLELILRAVCHPDGQPGLGSGHLTRRLMPGQVLRLSLRANPAGRAAGAQEPLVLIGAGSGIAGLLGHIRQRALLRDAGQPAGPIWLIFGERSARTDRILPELEALQDAGVITRLDRVFSRNAAPGAPRYAQDLLQHEAEMLRRWIAQGAAIHICGRRDGIGRDSTAMLAEVLGTPAKDALLAAGRIRLDLY